MKAKILLLTLLLTFSCRVSQTSYSRKSEIFLEDGVASWYGPGFQGKTTANGEKFNTNDFTAAHRTVPFGTHIKVVNSLNGKSVIVRINDRGPYAKNRIIDLSQAAARELEMIEKGTASVTLLLLGQQLDELGVENIKIPTYAIQIDAFSDSSPAQQRAKSFQDGWVKQVVVDGGKVYRVLIGNFRSVEQAAIRKADLASQGVNGFIKQVEN